MYLILIAGGHSSGKKTVTKHLVSRLKEEARNLCNLSTREINLANYQRTAHQPDIDFEKLYSELEDWAEEKETTVFIYGNYALYDRKLCSKAQLKIFLDTDADVRLSQRILRDSIETKTVSLAAILEDYIDNCRSEYEDFIEFTKKRADVFLPQGSDPLNIELLANGILEEILKQDQVSTVSVRRRKGTPMINLRADVASSFESRYYTTA